VLNVRDNACARCRALADDTDIVNDSQSVVGAGGWQVYLRNIIRENAENILVFGLHASTREKHGSQNRGKSHRCGPSEPFVNGLGQQIGDRRAKFCREGLFTIVWSA
jgi:hypothetical protein